MVRSHLVPGVRSSGFLSTSGRFVLFCCLLYWLNMGVGGQECPSRIRRRRAKVVVAVKVSLPRLPQQPRLRPPPGPLRCLRVPRLWHWREGPQPETPGTPRAPQPAKELRKSSPAWGPSALCRFVPHLKPLLGGWVFTLEILHPPAISAYLELEGPRLSDRRPGLCPSLALSWGDSSRHYPPAGWLSAEPRGPGAGRASSWLGLQPAAGRPSLFSKPGSASRVPGDRDTRRSRSQKTCITGWLEFAAHQG